MVKFIRVLKNLGNVKIPKIKDKIKNFKNF